MENTLLSLPNGQQHMSFLTQCVFKPADAETAGTMQCMLTATRTAKPTMLTTMIKEKQAVLNKNNNKLIGRADGDTDMKSH